MNCAYEFKSRTWRSTETVGDMFDLVDPKSLLDDRHKMFSRDDLYAELSKLSLREQVILKATIIGGEGLLDLGKRLKLTREHVRQIREQAYHKLRRQLMKKGC